MARQVVAAGFPTTIWARRPESVEPFATTAAVVAGSPAEVGAVSDVVGICVVADADVEQVLLGDAGVLAGMAPGGVVAIHSTVHPDTCVALQGPASAAGVGIVDAPVSGGGGAAAARQLLVMAGGSAEDVARCHPVFETFAEPVIHLGPLGSGQLAKLLNNLVFTAQVTVGLETFAFAHELGMDRGALAQVLAHGSGGSRAAAILAATGFNLSGLRQAAGLLEKDIGIMLDVTRRRGAGQPDEVVALARRTLATLTSPATPAERPPP
jgi:3-hydroxyisobutyrate dehydrogenase-like beta-hydroxyacid dehydrogenase